MPYLWDRIELFEDPHNVDADSEEVVLIVIASIERRADRDNPRVELKAHGSVRAVGRTLDARGLVVAAAIDRRPEFLELDEIVSYPEARLDRGLRADDNILIPKQRGIRGAPSPKN